MKQKYERPVINKINAGMPDKFGMKIKNKVISEIEGIPVKQIIEQFGSPTYVISERKIEETYTDAKRAFENRYPKVQFA